MIYDNHANDIEYFPIHRIVDYNTMSNDELDAEYKSLQAQWNTLEKYYILTNDKDTEKQLHRIARKQSIIQKIITYNNRYGKSISSKLIIKKLENKVKERDLRIAKLLREVERYKGVKK